MKIESCALEMQMYMYDMNLVIHLSMAMDVISSHQPFFNSD